MILSKWSSIVQVILFNLILFLFLSWFYSWQSIYWLLTGTISIIWIYRTKEFPVAISDKLISVHQLEIDKGALVIGGIGMGKTTFRFHLIHYFQNQGYRIIDFDYKGELSNDNLLLLQPGNNFVLNLFNPNTSTERYTNQLLHLIIETSIDEFSPAMVSLLRMALRETILAKRNLQYLFSAILKLGFQVDADEEFGSGKTAIAIINRLFWLQDDLGTVFNRSTNLHPDQISEDHLFFDLSTLTLQTDSYFIAAFINIMLRLLILGNHEKKKTAIFIEEAQLLMNYSDNLTSVKRIITTMRYREIPVFLIGTSIDHFPKSLFDASTNCSFRASNPGISENINELDSFEFIIRNNKYPVGKKFKLLPFKGSITIPNYINRMWKELPSLEFDIEQLKDRLIRHYLLHEYLFSKVTPMLLPKIKLTIEELIKYATRQSEIDPLDLVFSYYYQYPKYLRLSINSSNFKHFIRNIPIILQELSERLKITRQSWVIMNSRQSKD